MGGAAAVSKVALFGSQLAVATLDESHAFSSVATPPWMWKFFGGPAVQAIALGNVRKLRQKLRPSLAIVGCGGVDSGEAAFKHLLCGADAVMVASALLHEGESIFARIEAELLEIMASKGYSSIDQFRSKV